LLEEEEKSNEGVCLEEEGEQPDGMSNGVEDNDGPGRDIVAASGSPEVVTAAGDGGCVPR
jgi:hypothetical protein